MLSEDIKKKLCKITERAIEGLIDSIKDKKNPKIDNVVLLWNAVDYHTERCENNEEVDEDESISPKFYI